MSTVWALALIEYDDENESVEYLGMGTVEKIQDMPLVPVIHDPIEVIFVVDNPNAGPLAPASLEVEGTIQRETRQWAATIIGSSDLPAPVVVSVDILHLTYDSILPPETIVLFTPIREFGSMAALHEFMAMAEASAVVQISGGGSTPGDCDGGDFFCIACSPLDDCQQQAWNKYRLAIADCGSVNWGTAGGVTMGVAVGAGVGSIFPIIGTKIGAGIGGVVGFFSGGEWGRRDCLRRAMRVYGVDSDICWEDHDPFPNTPNEQHPCIERWLATD